MHGSIQLKHAEHQRGAVLVIGLIFLLVLTLVGVTAMRGTTLQERMAGNYSEVNVAFQRSEDVLRFGETNLITGATEAELQADAGFYRLIGGAANGVNLQDLRHDCTAELLLTPTEDGGAGIEFNPDPNNYGGYVVIEVSSLDSGLASTCIPVGSVAQGATEDNLSEKVRQFWVLSRAYGLASRSGDASNPIVEQQGARVDIQGLYTVINRPGVDSSAAGATP